MQGYIASCVIGAVLGLLLLVSRGSLGSYLTGVIASAIIAADHYFLAPLSGVNLPDSNWFYIQGMLEYVFFFMLSLYIVSSAKYLAQTHLRIRLFPLR